MPRDFTAEAYIEIFDAQKRFRKYPITLTKTLYDWTLVTGQPYSETDFERLRCAKQSPVSQLNKINDVQSIILERTKKFSQ